MSLKVIVTDRSKTDNVTEALKARAKERPPPPPPFGPEYPRELGATVAKFRRMASGGLRDFTKSERHAYGEAVEKAFRAKQVSALRSETKSHRVHCASGTDHTTGEEIHEAVRQQQLNKLYACPAAERKKRNPMQWQSLYDDAMKAKRERANRQGA